jgi:UDP-GlcNAc:undecaprenyl-phosphate GlcNAc-1-phosphate transferase
VKLAQPFLFALLVSAALVPICRAVALRLGYVAKGRVHPPQRRRPGASPTALFGGVAIALTFFGSTIALGAIPPVAVLMVCSAALACVGVASDLFSLKPSTKAIALIAVASVFLFFDLRLHWTESVTLDSIVTIFWIVGVTSAFNLLDHMDGLCSGIALIAGSAFLMTVLPVEASGDQFERARYLVLLLGAIAGFLIYNVHPAKVALGDSGSLLIGLNMAAMILQFAPGRGSNLLSVIAVPILVLLIPIVDATLVVLSRMRSGASGRVASDPSNRLVAIGLSERSAVTILWVLAATSGFIAVAADRGDRGITGLVAVLFTIGVALLAVYLIQVRVHENLDPYRIPATITPLGVSLGYWRRLAEVLLDLVLVSAAYYGAYRLLFVDANDFADNFALFFESFPIVLGAQMIALFAVGAYRGMWRYFTLTDGVIFAKAVFVGTVSAQAAVLYLYRFEGYSPNVFVLYAMAALLLLVTSRASFRLLSEFARREGHGARRLVIYGADDAGVAAVRHLLNDPTAAFRIVGFIDDDMSKRHVRVHGYEVIGGYDHLVGMIMAGEVDAVSVAHSGAAVAGLASLCAMHGVSLNRLAIDWREIPATDIAVGGGATAPPAAEARVVPFDALRRERLPADVAFGGAGHTGPTAAGPVVGVEAGQPPIRVIHIITRLILGGAQENTLYTAIGHHRDPRFDVTLLCGVDEAGEGDMFGQVTRAGLKTVVLPSLVREIRPLTDLKALFDIYRFLRKGSYTIVHTHSSKAGIIGRLAARAAGVPIIVHTLHGLVFHEFQSIWKNRVYIAFKRLCAPLTHRIISVSDRVSQGALAAGIGRPDQHVTIFSGIELDLFLSVRERLTVEDAKGRAGIPPNALVVGKIARLFPLKGHAQFLEVAAAVARQMPDVWFLLVGDGPLREELRAEARRLGIDERLVMVGRVPPEQVPEYIQAMDVVVHTSLREGIARVLPQAGAVGKPVVTFHLDGAPEVIREGGSGHLVPASDTTHVAERTVELLRDPERRHAFGEAGRAFAAEHFSVDRMIERIADVYLDLVARHAGKS